MAAISGETRDSALISGLATTLTSRGFVCLRVHGSSMLPWMRPGDLLMVERVESSQIAVGDVVLFAREARLFVHRVIHRSAPGCPLLVTKGDAVDQADAPLSRVELLGRVSSILRGRRQILLDSPQQILAGRLVARVSPSSRYWFPLARAAKRLLRAAHRLSV